LNLSHESGFKRWNYEYLHRSYFTWRVLSFSSRLHVEHNQRGVGGQVLRPISQGLCYIYLPIHIQYPSSKIRSMQIFIISPKTNCKYLMEKVDRLFK
jgi:hypothetical protein